MNQTLWISLPQLQINALKGLFDYIQIKKLSPLNFNQLAEKLTPLRKDRDWLGLFAKYNKIPNINPILKNQLNQLFSRVIGLIAKLKSYDASLSSKTFQPNELMSLLIIYNINENIFDTHLCKALAENDLISIKKEILEKENSSSTRISEINTYLLIYSFYTNDDAVKLPQNVIDATRLYAKQNDIFLTEIDNRIRNVRSPTPTYYPSVPENYSCDLMPIEADGLLALANKSSVNYINNTLMMITSLFLLLKQIPVIYQVGKNIHKDLTQASHLIRNSFFKRNLKSIDKNLLRSDTMAVSDLHYELA